MIVAKDNFKYIDRFFTLLNLHSVTEIVSTGPNVNIQFFTEYSLIESIHRTKRKFFELPETKDTPDIVILVSGLTKVLIALEAKMFDAPTNAKLTQQMDNQRKILGSIASTLEIGASSIYHFALLPEELKSNIEKNFKYDCITWQELRDEFKDVCKDDYFFNILELALEEYDNLAAKTLTFGANSERKIKGINIFSDFKNGKPGPKWIGREGGIHGGYLRDDISKERRWERQSYETRREPPPHSAMRNWFTIEAFVNAVDEFENIAKRDN